MTGATTDTARGDGRENDAVAAAAEERPTLIATLLPREEGENRGENGLLSVEKRGVRHPDGSVEEAIADDVSDERVAEINEKSTWVHPDGGPAHVRDLSSASELKGGAVRVVFATGERLIAPNAELVECRIDDTGD